MLSQQPTAISKRIRFFTTQAKNYLGISVAEQYEYLMRLDNEVQIIWQTVLEQAFASGQFANKQFNHS